jgi:hypothetical protein
MMIDSIPAAMRDPQGELQQYRDRIAVLEDRWAWRDTHFSSQPLHNQVAFAGERISEVIQFLMLAYARGDSVERIGKEVSRSLTVMVEALAFYELNGPKLGDGFGGSHGIDGVCRDDLAYGAFALCTLETPEQLAEWTGLFDDRPTRRSYLFDLMACSFVPGYRMAKKYKRDRYQAPWAAPVLRALALPPEVRHAALAEHMRKWCRILKPWGWKAKLDLSYGKDNLFFHFAYEVALAVCAYDIDDSAFAGHPYYPRDLVQWYRTHLRHTRDAWRPVGVGAGIPVEAPPLPAKVDLAKSKRKAIARWLELAADGDADAVDSVIETVGRLRKVEDIDELVGALYESGQAIYADVKDDETLELTAGQLAEERGIGDFEGPPGPPFGPARCEAILDVLAAWVALRSYTLFRFESDGDAWCAVLVRAAYADEFGALSDSLRIRIDPGS